MFITLYSTAYINRILSELDSAGLPIVPEFLTALNDNFDDTVREYTQTQEFADYMTGKDYWILTVVTRNPSRVSESHNRKYTTYKRANNTTAELRKSATATVPLEFTFYSNNANYLELLEEWLLTSGRSLEESRIDLEPQEITELGVNQLSIKAKPGEVGGFSYLGSETGSIFTLQYSAEVDGVVLSPEKSQYPLLLRIYLRFYYKAKTLVTAAPHSAPEFTCLIDQTI